MKTTLLLTASLFFVSASFAQTTIKNSGSVKDNTSIQSNKSGSQLNSSGSASSSTSIQSQTPGNVENKSYAEVAKGKKTVATEKNNTRAKTTTAAENSEKMKPQNVSVSSSENSHTKVKAGKNESNASTRISVENNNSAAENEKHVSTTAKTTVSGTNKKIKETSSSAIEVGAKAKRVVQPRPASVKMNTQIKSNAGIKIK